MRQAELRIDETSATCVRYTLVAAGVIIWRNRVEPSERGHQGARTRMAAWALAHNVEVVEAQALPAPEAPRQRVIAGRYGRH